MTLDLLNIGHGIDIQRRRDGTNWPKPWRVRLIWTKNERANFRVIAFGDTMEEALAAMWKSYLLNRS